MEKIGKMVQADKRSVGKLNSGTRSHANKNADAIKWHKVEDPGLRRLRSSKRWQDLRRQILLACPVCYLCRRLGGALRPATDIHHVIPAREMIESGGEEAFFELRNLIPLCVYHHERNENAWKDGTAETLFPESDRLTWERIS